ncbi:hypothetical protein G4B88_019486 [Cannabis sativa]|uniref:Myb/SANT-like domain-containing protein n=1 Tax=Cannabis sativa TaxID=3483 RepID=A0A7J6HYB6_CANSA|nr:hypothetical protein G4B88_019486 [Cannabis sativa]
MARLSLARKQKMSSNSNVDQRGRGKNKHYWTLEQDNALIVCLLELSRNLTRRADCGFKNSYLQQMESMLEAKLLDSNLKASPHIESRIKTLKGKCNCGLYGKSFPYYHKLVEIYGRDCVTGANGDNADDDEEEIRHDDATGVKFGVDDNINDGGDDEEIDEFDGISNTQQPTNMCRRRSTESTTNNQKSGKNKKSNAIDSISTNIGALAESVSEIVPKLQGLTDALSDKNVTEMQDNLYTKISKIEGLTIRQCIRATNILLKEPALMRIFYAISY